MILLKCISKSFSLNVAYGINLWLAKKQAWNFYFIDWIMLELLCTIGPRSGSLTIKDCKPRAKKVAQSWGPMGNWKDITPALMAHTSRILSKLPYSWMIFGLAEFWKIFLLLAGLHLNTRVTSRITHTKFTNTTSCSPYFKTFLLYKCTKIFHTLCSGFITTLAKLYTKM